MTVIAWDGHSLAADKRGTAGGGLARTVTKIERIGSALVGISGEFDTGAEMREWFRAGADPAQFPRAAREDKSTLVVIEKAGILSWATGPYPMTIRDRFSAWGSGRDFALAALYLGHDAEKAVRVACEFQTDCGNGVDVLRLFP